MEGLGGNVSELKMWGTRLLLKRVGRDAVNDVMPSGLIDPNADAHQRHNQWEIQAVGDGVRDVMLAPGARVIVRAWATEEVRLGDDVYRIAYENDVVGVLA